MIRVDVTAAICTAGERDTLEGSLRTLLGQDPDTPVDLEVVVVDNSRHDNGFVQGVVERCARSAGVPVQCVRETRVGLGYARNAAVAAAEGEVIAFLDDDVLVDPRWASELVKAYRETGAAVVGGRIDPVWTVERPPWLGDELLGYLSILDHGPDRKLCSYPRYPFGANISFQRDLLRELGGFATNLGGGGGPTYLMDETEVCRRVERAGRQILYAPTVRVGHIVPASRVTRDFFVKRAAVLGRATARMGCQGDGVGWCTRAKGLPMAALRAARHAARAALFSLAGRKRESLSEERHLAWNLAWMWETALIAVKGL